MSEVISTCWNVVARVQLRRAIRTVMRCNNTISLEIMLTSEFNDPVPLLIQNYNIVVTVHSVLSNDYSNSNSNSYSSSDYNKSNGCNSDINSTILSITNYIQTGEVTKFTVQLPDCGVYTLTIAATLNTNRSTNDNNNSDSSINNVNTNNNSFCKSCSYSYNYGNSLSEKAFVLGYHSEIFTVTNDEELLSQYQTPLLCCYRHFSSYYKSFNSSISSGTHDNGNSNDDGSINSNSGSDTNSINRIVIKEEYGVGLGSHVYDSSIVLLHYLKQHSLHQLIHECISAHSQSIYPQLDTNSNCNIVGVSSANDDTVTNILEVGAGCGLLGIALAKESSKNIVLLTDKQAQISLLQQNITMNYSSNSYSSSDSCKENISCQVFEWQSKEQADEIVCHFPSRTIDVILAADVLYDKEQAQQFFTIVKYIGIVKKTVLLLAQKIRNDLEPFGTVDVRSIEGLTNITLLHREAKVLIWKVII